MNYLVYYDNNMVLLLLGLAFGLIFCHNLHSFIRRYFKGEEVDRF